MKYLYFYHDGSLLIVEQTKLNNEFDFRHSKLWIVEPNRRLVIYQSLDRKLLKSLGCRSLVIGTTQEISAFKMHLMTHMIQPGYSIYGNIRAIKQSLKGKQNQTQPVNNQEQA